MDCADHSAVLLASEVAQGLHHRGSCEGVETGSGFVKEDQVGVRDQLYTDRGTLALATRDTFDKGTTNTSVLALC